MNQNLQIEIGSNMQINAGCAATLFGQMWYFGSGSDPRQVIKFEGCKMIELTDKLTFEFNAGSCQSFESPISKILLCFSYLDPQICYTLVV